MPIVNISMWSGRTKEQKSKLVQAITDDFVQILGTRPEAVQVIINEVDKENWAIGGKLQNET